MNVMTSFFVYGIVLASMALIGATFYWFILKYRVRKLIEKVPTALAAGKPFLPDMPSVMRYSEYRHRFNSRTREIAILAPSKQKGAMSLVQEFTNTMREHGSLLYHFTQYWGMNDVKTMQKDINQVIKGKYDALATIGLAATRLAQHTTITQSTLLPTVFMAVRDTWVEQELTKREHTHITGVTGSSGWPTRISVYMRIKPDMKAALVPVAHECPPSDAAEIAQLLRHYGVTPHVVKVHDAHEVLHALATHANKIDSFIPLRNGLTTHVTSQLAALCAQHGIAYFSPFLNDIHHGAAVTVSCANDRIGTHAAYKMIAILENHKSPAHIPMTNIGTDITYEAHFNQLAMRAQGLATPQLTSFSLHHGTHVHVSLPEDTRV